MSAIVLRDVGPLDHVAVRHVETEAFGQPLEAELVTALRRNDDVVLELLAWVDDEAAGHILFSRLIVDGEQGRFSAVALAPLAVMPHHQRRGIGAALIGEAHRRLREGGEMLSVVLGDPAYYGRFGYSHARAAAFESVYQDPALQALAWGPAPTRGRLFYAAAFAAL